MAKNRNNAARKTVNQRKEEEKRIKQIEMKPAGKEKKRITCDRKCGKCYRKSCPIREKVCYRDITASGSEVLFPKVGSGSRVFV